MQLDGLAKTPTPPYYAVIFTSRRSPVEAGYGDTAKRMLELAVDQPGFLGVDSARENGLGITVSYWENLEAIAAWKRNLEHRQAQAAGKKTWYDEYQVRVAKVERDDHFARVQ